MTDRLQAARRFAESQGVVFEPGPEGEAAAATEKERLDRPATTGDIERLIQALNNGWVGRGFAIAVGIAILNFLVGLALGLILLSNLGA